MTECARERADSRGLERDFAMLDRMALRNARRCTRLWARLWLLALAALLALGGALVLAPASAAVPSGLQLELSLADDSDNVVPAGSTVRVKAALKYTGAAELALSSSGGSLFVAGNLEWESTNRLRLSVAQQKALGGAFGPYTGQADGAKFIAMDGRTMALGGTGVSLVDLENPTRNPYNMSSPMGSQIYASRDQTTGGFAPSSAGSNAPSGSAGIPFGTDGSDTGGVAGTRYWSAAKASGEPRADVRGFGRSVAVWHETDDIAWVFVGSKNDTVNGHPNIGRLYIYKVVYDGNRRTVTLERNIEPQPQDYMNHYAVANSATGKAAALFGSSVAISANGKFLAVAAAEINLIGAVYVYERPGLRTPTNGPGATTNNLGVTAWADWGDLTQNSAAKLTAINLPDWDRDGDAFQTKPGGYDFADPADGTADGATKYWQHWGSDSECDAACKTVWSHAYTDFGKDALAISEDGLTIVVGAEQKALPNFFATGRSGYYWPPCRTAPCTVASHAAGQNWEGNFRNGEAYVFTPIPANQTAGYWRGANLWMLGSPTGVEVRRTLQAQPFGEGPGVQNFGARIDISNDGKSVAVTAPGAPGSGVDPSVDYYEKKTPSREGKVYVFNRPGGGWSAGLDNSPDATFQLAAGIDSPNFGAHNVDFSPDSRSLAITDALGTGGGRAWIFSGTSGAWRSATTAGATGLYQPLANPTHQFGWATYELGGGDDNADNRLMVGNGRHHVWLYDKDLNALQGDPDNGGPCRFDPVDGEAFNGDDAFSCELVLPDSSIVIPLGTPDGPFTISGSVTVDGQTFSDTLEVTVGTVDEVSQIEFDFDTRADGSSYPSSVARVGATSTQMRLKILNENGGASARGSISSVFFTTSQGRLSASIGGKAGACQTSGSLSCQLSNTSTTLTASNADQIRLTLTAPSDAKPGTATVRAHVVSTAGQQHTQSLSVAIAGAFKTLKIGEPATSLLNVDTPDSGTQQDNRDIALLAVTAEDESGNRVQVPETAATMPGGNERAIPDHRLTIKDPDGKRNPTGISARWLPNMAGTGLQLDAQGNPQIELDVDAAASAALPRGEYAIEVQIDRETWTQTFRVSSGPAEVALTAPTGEVAVGSELTVTATVKDEDGRPVADGTTVTFSEESVGMGVKLILRTMAAQRTVDGEATATVLAVSAGSGYVIAQAGEIRDLELIRIAGAAAPTGATGLAADISSTEPNEFAVWLSDTTSRASSLLPRLEGVLSIQRWIEGRWLRYAVVNNQLVPGSMDFQIPRGAVLWLANGN